ncbi:uncharacterized protein LOC112521435 [Cynara cardunculus var. scolymus]|uniref:uncharacterized protein LOC112521435 n=1 Tax=Cynara cardunculus var. scolymus TaxID=59895 RepID=UPI000D625C3E|nr:uncharacterized protein LOC112521435 [Cynara cardunculus var. scolymus]
MRPLLCHGYLSWCILAGHIFVIVLSMSSGQYERNFTDKGTGSSIDTGPFPTVGSEISTLNYIQRWDDPPLSYNGISCEELGGVGSFDTTCLLNSDVNISSDLYVSASGNIEILPSVLIVCPIEGCVISFNLSGNIKVGKNSAIIAGSVIFSAANMSMESYSSINTTAMGGAPPSQTSGTPVGHEGAGGGHGGRGASCLRNNNTTYWGGDVYAWSTLPYPWSYGSKGGGTSDEHKYGGNGGGRVKLIVKDLLYMNGSLLAEGGDGGLNGGGGSGGSVVIHALKLKGFGIVSASGGSGWGGGGGGRVSLDCHSKQEDIKVKVHGGHSIGCPMNGGAAGTCFDAYLLSLRVDNDNVTTETETPLLDFSTSPLWTNVYIENDAKVLVPLRWSRVQVRGQIKLDCGGSIIFGLSDFPVSEFELVAEELLMSDSTIKVYGALRATFKMVLMWNAQIQVDGGGSTLYTISVLEVRNLIVLRENSSINSNTNLAVYGQGLLRLTGQGDAIKAQRLSLSLFYNITIGPGSLLEAPLDDDNSKSMATKSHCENPTCPRDLIYPPDDCHVNDTLSFSLQICRVEDIVVNGIIKGSIIQIHRARTVIVETEGMITASELGCRNGFGLGNYSNGAGGGAGHGGRGGTGLYDGRLSEGGSTYGKPDLPCELGSGTLGPNESVGRVAGGGMIVMGSILWPLTKLDIYGSMRADGQSYGNATTNSNGTLIGGLGGGSGGTVLLFIQAISLFDNSSLSVAGGHGVSVGGGGGGGGRVHFHWSKIGTGDEYVPLAMINSTISTWGGEGDGEALPGEEGTITGRKCPKGLYGTFCEECPVGTFKDVEGSDDDLCTPCSLENLPRRAFFVHVRGGVPESFCPYKCRSEKYRMPNCYTPLEELIYTFGGPWPFALMLSCVVILLGLFLSTLRVKLVGQAYAYEKVDSNDHSNHHHFPSLLSLSQVRGTRADETQSHVYRMYFLGPNTFREPWHLPYSPPDAIIDIVYEDSFNRFIDEINSVAAYDWWEGSVHSILSLLAYPCGWSWKQWRRRYKINRLQEFVKSEYDHSCLRSCRSRALYKGMKVGATPDLVVAYIDFFLGGDEKRLDMVTSIQKRFPMCIIFGGAGSYMSPYNLHSDTLLTNLIGQHVPSSVWNRLVAGLNAQLRTVRSGSIRSALVPVINWIKTHGNPQLEFHGVKIELGWFQATASGFYQLGILVIVGDDSLHNLHQPDLIENSEESPRHFATIPDKSLKQLQPSQSYTSHALTRKRVASGVNGAIINDASLKSLDFRRDYFFPFSLFLHNTRPTGRQGTLQLLICILLLSDLSVTLLILLEFYWISLGAFLAVLLILPLSLLSPFPAGLNALFSRGHKRASLARIYALWNSTSVSNIVVSFMCGMIHYGFLSFQTYEEPNAWQNRSEDDAWWLLPTLLMLLKVIQARFVDWHIANLEVEDFSLFCPDPDTFWAYETTL